MKLRGSAVKWLLRLLVVNFHGAIAEPAVAKQALLAHEVIEDKFAADFVHALICNDGDWRGAVVDLSRQRGGHHARLKGLQAWCEKLTARPVRGLLSWPGGAS